MVCVGGGLLELDGRVIVVYVVEVLKGVFLGFGDGGS